MKPVMIISTYPDRAVLRRIARELVSSGVAACVNIIRTSSVYMWDGRLEDTAEYIGIFKTVPRNKRLLQERIRQTHPYEVPEIAEIDVTSVNRPYYDWLAASAPGRSSE